MIFRTILAVPTLDIISWQTFEYSRLFSLTSHRVGIFEWGLLYKEMPAPKRELEKNTYQSEPYRFKFVEQGWCIVLVCIRTL